MISRRAATRLALAVLILVGGLALPDQSRAQSDDPSAIERTLDFSPYPLRPPELDSPRATLRSFVTNMNQAIERVRDEKPLHARRRSFVRAMLCLDLSEIPLATREKVGTEKVLLLKEILDRIEVPPFDEIPDAAAVKEQGLSAWTIPNTELTLVRVEEGPRTGAFLFSARTVAHLERFYELSAFLPYKPGASIGAYEDYLYGPGLLLPRAWVTGLPSWAYVVVAQQTVWQWIGLVLLVAVAVLATLGVYRCGVWWDQRFGNRGVWAQLGKPLTAVFLIVAMQLLSRLVNDAINVTGTAFIVTEFATKATSYAAVAWLAALIITRLGEGIIEGRRISKTSVQFQLIRTLARLIAVLVVIYIAVAAAESFGIPLAPLIAGLGVGGLAVALAVRPTLENIVGGFMLFADQPVRVGDLCSFGDKTGTVEQIGLRSTRLRASDRTVVTIPNSLFANMQLVNWAACDRMLIENTVGLRSETKPEQIRYVLVKLRQMFLAHPKIDQETTRIRFAGPGLSSQDIQIRVYVLTRDWSEFYAVREDVFLRVGEIVEAAGTDFATPSQNLFVGRDRGLDEERSAEAMQQVDAWRRSGRLPFPRMTPRDREALADTLDYPPRGSADELRPDDLKDEAPEPLSKEPETDAERETRAQKPAE